MKKVIFKYSLGKQERQSVELPKGAEILSIQTQLDVIQLWAFVDSDNEREEREIEIFGTGNPIPYEKGFERRYISTFQVYGGHFVFHAFERFKNIFN